MRILLGEPDSIVRDRPLFRHDGVWTADHYQYLAIIGLALAVVVLVEEISAMLSEQWSRVMRYAATAGAVAVLAILSQSQAKVWSTPESLWKHALENNPRSFMAHLNYGSVLQERGRCDEAEPILRRALAMMIGTSNRARSVTIWA